MRALLPVILIAAYSEILPAQFVDSTRTGLQAPVVVVPYRPQGQVSLTTPPNTTRTTASTKSMILGGLIGGALGAFGGAMVGKAVEKCDLPAQNNCGVAGMVIGGLVGESIGVPIGVNFVANGRNTLHRSIPTSLGLMVGGLILSAGGYYAFIPGTPALQVYSSISFERTGRIGLFGR
jgi:hypothetical protein